MRQLDYISQLGVGNFDKSKKSYRYNNNMVKKYLCV